MSNLALIQANRGATSGAWMRAGGTNPYAGPIAVAAVLLLLLVLGVPVLSQLFAFAMPGPGLLLVCCATATLTPGWCELLRWSRRRAAGACTSAQFCAGADV